MILGRTLLTPGTIQQSRECRKSTSTSPSLEASGRLTFSSKHAQNCLPEFFAETKFPAGEKLATPTRCEKVLQWIKKLRDKLERFCLGGNWNRQGWQRQVCLHFEEFRRCCCFCLSNKSKVKVFSSSSTERKNFQELRRKSHKTLPEKFYHSNIGHDHWWIYDTANFYNWWSLIVSLDE